MWTLWLACTTHDGAPTLESPVDSPTDSPVDSPDPSAPPTRVLILIADDLGIDVTRAYAGSGAPMPHVERVCAEGVRFDVAWANHVCSPSRATLLTGLHGFRTGVGAPIPPGGSGLQPDVVTLPQWLREHTDVRAASFGKWHVGAGPEVGGDTAPTTLGWEAWSGVVDGVISDYESWPRTEDGITSIDTRYHTTATVDDSLAWLDGVSVDEPWLLWVGFVAPHDPFHAPPPDLHSYTLEGDPADDVRSHFEASIEAMDTEIGRLFDELDARGMGDVTVIFLGDNGTANGVVAEGRLPNKAKNTLYDGGVHVPLCVSGPGIAPAVSNDLVHSVDLFATVGDLFAVTADSPAIDSVSMAPILSGEPGQRTWIYSEGFDTTRESGNGRVIRNDDYKLIRFDEGRPQAFDCAADPWDDHDLLDGELDSEAAAQLAELGAILDELEAGGRGR